MTAKEERKHLKNYFSTIETIFLESMKEREIKEIEQLNEIIWRNQCEIEIINEILKERKLTNKN